MTDQHHPLTDEICERVSRRCVSTTTSIERDNMRTAADWQLEQCLEFLQTHPFHERDDYGWSDAYAYAQLMEEAMRPTQDNK